MDAGHAHQMGAAGLVELLQIGQVLEVVGVLVAVLHGGVGHHVVAVLVDHQLDALLRQDGHALVQNLGVGGGGGGHRQGDGLSGIAARLGGGAVISGAAVIGGAAAGRPGTGTGLGPAAGPAASFFMFRSSNKILFMMYFKRLPDFQRDKR